MNEIKFRRQNLGTWKRTDGESNQIVSDERAFKEIAKLLNSGEGWTMETSPTDKSYVKTILMKRMV